MPRTPFRTPVEDLIITPGDVVRGEDQTAGGDVLVRGGNSTGGGNPGGDLSLRGGAGITAGGGGTVLVMGGTAGATGVGGGVTLQGSDAGMGAGGYVFLVGGAGAGGGERGAVRITNTALEFVEATTVPGGVTAAGRGRVWVRDDAPNVLIFTDDTGVDNVLGSGGASTLSSVVANVGVSPSLQSAPFVWQISDTEFLTFEGVTANENLLTLAHTSGADVITVGHGGGDRLNALTATNNFFFGATFDSASTGGPPPIQGIRVGVTTNTIDSLSSGSTFLIRGLNAGGGVAGDITIQGGNKAAGIGGNGGAASLLGGSTGATSTTVGGVVTIAGGQATAGDAAVTGGAVVVMGGQASSGTGGEVTISAGTGDTGGALIVEAGQGGTVAGAAILRGGAAAGGALLPGGDITVIGGAGDSDDIGGAVFITGGPAGAGTTTGPGAAVTVTGGTGGGVAGEGGGVAIVGGPAGGGNSFGGAVSLTGGTGNGTGSGGDMSLASGSPGGTSTSGSQIVVTAGVPGTATGTGGDIVLNAGSTSGAGVGGNVTVNPGTTIGGTDGEFLVQGNAHVTGKLTVDGLIDPTGLVLTEQAASPFSAAGMGTIWVQNTVPSTMVFTDDAGTDFPVSVVAQSYSTVRGATSRGTTNTLIYRWVAQVGSAGTDITYTDSGANGGSWTINTNGVYAVSVSIAAGHTGMIAIKMEATLSNTFNQTSIVAAVATNAGAGADLVTMSWTGPIAATQVVWIATDTATDPDNGTPNVNRCTVTRVL